MTHEHGRTPASTTHAARSKRVPEPSGRPRGAGAVRATQDRPGPRDAVRERPRYTTVNLRVHEIRCLATTGEVGADEVLVAAVTVEGALGGTTARRQLVARARRGEQLSAGRFTKGDRRTYPATRVLASYDAGGPIGTDPRFFLGAVLLIEQDEGHADAVISRAVESVERQVAAAVSTVAATASGAALAGIASGAALGSVVPLVGTAIGAAAGAAVGLAVGEIAGARADEVFPIERVELELSRFPDEPGEIPGSRRTLTFKGFSGQYVVEISWAVR